MAFNRENLTIVNNNVKNGSTPKLYTFWNESTDDVTAAGYFTDKRLAVGDQIEVLAAAYTSSIRYRVSAVSDGAATVISAATATFTPGGIDTRTGAGAISVTAEYTNLVTTAADALTLADGVAGQRKVIKMKTDGGDGTLTPANFADGTTITFNSVGDVVELIFADGKWNLVSNVGCVIA